MCTNKYKKLFEPIIIGKCKIKNLFALAPMGSLGLADNEVEIPEIHLLGDARKVSNIMYAIWDAY
jgi:2,4-dienoyl-CoA reductase-like NADH-dependent reductase (Old Yellow Enzyme family)